METSNNETIFDPQVVADIQREFNDDGFEKETSTHSAMVYHLLNVGDMVKVKFNKVCQYSYIDINEKIEFLQINLEKYQYIYAFDS